MIHSSLHSGAHATDSGFRIVRELPREIAFGRSVAYLMSKPVFAKAPFGHIARSLAGQVNRGHYAFVYRENAIVGFVGWALANEVLAEAWLNGQRALSGTEAENGDCVLLNFWQAETPQVSQFIIVHMREVLTDVRRIYAKRHYADGRIRPIRLNLRSRA